MEHRGKRIFMAVFGVSLAGVSVGLFKLSLFGTDPFQCLVTGIWNVVRIGYGTLYTILNLAMLVGIFFINRKYIGIATFINIFGTGYIAQFATSFFGRFFTGAGLGVRIALLVCGLALMCFASAFYYTAELGVSTYDAVALILADRKVAKFRYCRIGADLVCVLIGVLLKATVGVGTLLTAFCMGPLIEFFNKCAARPFLYGKGRPREETQAS